jgi:3-dehydroquinate dehydratase II
MKKILALNGPNLNLLGNRERDTYGTCTLTKLHKQLEAIAKANQIILHFEQRNNESELIEIIHEGTKQGIDYIIFNPAAYTHTSIALRDALLAVNIPFIEVHISNVYQRETFRHHSYFSDIAQGVIVGFGVQGYKLALQAIIEQIN